MAAKPISHNRRSEQAFPRNQEDFFGEYSLTNLVGNETIPYWASSENRVWQRRQIRTFAV